MDFNTIQISDTFPDTFDIYGINSHFHGVPLKMQKYGMVVIKSMHPLSHDI